MEEEEEEEEDKKKKEEEEEAYLSGSAIASELNAGGARARA